MTKIAKFELSKLIMLNQVETALKLDPLSPLRD